MAEQTEPTTTKPSSSYSWSSGGAAVAETPKTTTEAKTAYQLTAPETMHDSIRHALREHGDQARSDELDINGGLTITLGLRNVYFRAGTNHVAACPITWTELATASDNVAELEKQLAAARAKAAQGV